MKILILSDNHSRSLDFDFSKYDYIIHCGDYGNSYDVLNQTDALFVRGNCDYDGPKEIFREINNKKVLVLHGDLYNVKYHYNSLIYKALSRNAHVVFFGHTHRADMFIEDNILFINPGSYQDGSYVVINDDYIIFYKFDKEYKRFEYRW